LSRKFDGKEGGRPGRLFLLHGEGVLGIVEGKRESDIVDLGQDQVVTARGGSLKDRVNNYNPDVDC
jgi:hypothetical protein